MAGISTICQYPTNLVSVMPPSLKPTSNTSMLTSNFVRFPSKPKARFTGGVRNKFSFPLRAAVDVDFEIEKSDPEEPTTEIGLLKKQLVDLFYGTNYGINASSETRAEILELITQLEVLNPTPEPTEALSLLNGKWILAYTSFVSLYHLPSSETLPLVKVKEISQTIDSENFTVQNSVVFSGPGSTTAISAIATFEIRSPKLVQLKFDEGIIGTPQLTDSIPESIEIFGHVVDLSSFKGWVTSVEETISSQPPFKFSLAKTNVESWLLTTYLDEELRISRGDGGKVYVLFPEGSSYLLP